VRGAVVPVLLVPRGPVTVPLVELVEPLFVVVPEAVVVPPLGPVTEPDSVEPVRVLVTEPEAEAVLPRALVAVPEAETVLPDCETAPLAVPPRLPETVFCAKAEEQERERTAAARTKCFIVRSLRSRVVCCLHMRTHGFLKCSEVVTKYRDDQCTAGGGEGGRSASTFFCTA
jgi:hypothetical protein